MYLDIDEGMFSIRIIFSDHPSRCIDFGGGEGGRR